MDSSSTQNSTRRIPLTAWAMAAVFAALLGIAFYQPIVRMVDIWNAAESYYSHGWLVPAVALYLVWRRRDQLTLEPAPSMIGFYLMLAGLFTLMVSGWLVVFFTAGFGLILTIWGMCGFLFGDKVLRRLTFPAFILCFMVPPPEQMIASISLSMKLLATRLAIWVIDLFGIVAVEEAQTIYLGDSFVTVGNACSGLRSLISLIFLGVLFASFSKLPPLRRVVLALSSVPIAIISNVVRIVALSLVAYFWGTQAVSGFVHDASGYMIFVVAFFLLFGVTMLLQWGLRSKGAPGEQPQ